LLRGHGPVDFSRGWWHPPVTPRVLFESEVAQIDRRFGVKSIVSVTDHDDISACVELQQLYAAERVPISLEWTVPYGPGFFHLGVHNLPVAQAREWFTRLSAFTAARSERLDDILVDLDALRGSLIVFNHPLWDLARVGHATHATQLQRFLADHGSRLHALELNGFRSREENGGVRRLATELDIPLVSGGDRHALAANALVNLTRATSFAEFASEIREGMSHIVVMPEYRTHCFARSLAAASEVLRHYRTYPIGRRHWTDRVSWHGRDGIRPLSHHWPTGGPWWLRASLVGFRLFASPAVLPVMNSVWTRRSRSSAIGPIPLSG
jgi:hypothetical protein